MYITTPGKPDFPFKRCMKLVEVGVIVLHGIEELLNHLPLGVSPSRSHVARIDVSPLRGSWRGGPISETSAFLTVLQNRIHIPRIKDGDLAFPKAQSPYSV